MGRDVVV